MLARSLGLACLALAVGGCEPLTFTAATAAVGLAAWDMAATPDAPVAEGGAAPMAAGPGTEPAMPAAPRAAMAATPPRPASAGAMPAGSPAMTAGTADYVVIGSFRSASNAEMMRRAHMDKATQISVAQSKGAPLYRVVVGPFASAGVTAAKSEFTRSGVPGTWAIKLCTRTMAPAPCDTTG